MVPKNINKEIPMNIASKGLVGDSSPTFFSLIGVQIREVLLYYLLAQWAITVHGAVTRGCCFWMEGSYGTP